MPWDALVELLPSSVKPASSTLLVDPDSSIMTLVDEPVYSMTERSLPAPTIEMPAFGTIAPLIWNVPAGMITRSPAEAALMAFCMATRSLPPPDTAPKSVMLKSAADATDGQATDKQTQASRYERKYDTPLHDPGLCIIDTPIQIQIIPRHVIDDPAAVPLSVVSNENRSSRCRIAIAAGLGSP